MTEGDKTKLVRYYRSHVDFPIRLLRRPVIEQLYFEWCSGGVEELRDLDVSAADKSGLLASKAVWLAFV